MKTQAYKKYTCAVFVIKRTNTPRNFECARLRLTEDQFFWQFFLKVPRRKILYLDKLYVELENGGYLSWYYFKVI